MNLFLQLLANGLVTGTFYALSALGLTLVFGLMRVVNFAHGELYMVGGLIGWALGIGRLGGIAGPAIGGALLAFGLPPKQIFLCACGPALIAAGATLLLTIKAARSRDVIAAAPQARTA